MAQSGTRSCRCRKRFEKEGRIRPRGRTQGDTDATCGSDVGIGGGRRGHLPFLGSGCGSGRIRLHAGGHTLLPHRGTHGRAPGRGRPLRGRSPRRPARDRDRALHLQLPVPGARRHPLHRHRRALHPGRRPGGAGARPARSVAQGRRPRGQDAVASAIGEFAYAVLEDPKDFALIRLDPGVEASPEMCHFGGPTGIFEGDTPDTTVLSTSATASASVLPCPPVPAWPQGFRTPTTSRPSASPCPATRAAGSSRRRPGRRRPRHHRGARVRLRRERGRCRDHGDHPHRAPAGPGVRSSRRPAAARHAVTRAAQPGLPGRSRTLWGWRLRTSRSRRRRRRCTGTRAGSRPRPNPTRCMSASRS